MDDAWNDTNPPNEAVGDDSPTTPAPPRPVLDLEKYRPQVAALELSPEQERELLETLWRIMMACVDLGFGFDPVHHLFADRFEKASAASQDPLEPDKNIVNEQPGEDT